MTKINYGKFNEVDVHSGGVWKFVVFLLCRVLGSFFLVAVKVEKIE